MTYTNPLNLIRIIKLFVIKLINDTMLKYKIITEAFSRLVSIVVSYEPEDE